jgi:hypothetical protein
VVKQHGKVERIGKKVQPLNRGSASVSAERIYQGYIPYIGWHSYALIRTWGSWQWNESQVLDVWGVGVYDWADEINYCHSSGASLYDCDWIPPCDYYWWDTPCSYYMQGPGEQPHHHFSLWSEIQVEGDGWWRCSYGYSGNGPGLFHRFIDTPSAGQYQKS